MKKQKGYYGMSDYRFELEVPENYVGIETYFFGLFKYYIVSA